MTAGFLRKCSFTYLLLPNLVFSLGWFRAPYSVILVFGFLYLLAVEYLKADSGFKLSFKDIFYLLLFALVWTFFCGVDGLSTQELDWLGHNSKLYDLYKNPWPNFFPEVNRSSCYYFGYYLVPAFISKLAGRLLPSFLVGWTVLGFFLGLSWIYILINRNRFLLILMPFIRGVGQIGIFFLGKMNIYHVKIPLINPSLRSIFQQSLFVTNQVIPAMIVCGVILYDCFLRKKMDESFVFIVVSFVWAIFPSITLVLIFGALLIHKYFVEHSVQEFFKMEAVNSYLIPGMLFIPIFLYFLSSDQISDQGFIWNHVFAKQLLFGYVTGIAFDLIIFFTLARFLIVYEVIVPPWFLVVLFSLIFLLSIYHIGMYNDFFFRGSIPLHIIIVTIILRGINVCVRSKKWPSSARFVASGVVVAILLCVQLMLESHLLRDNAVVSRFYPQKAHLKVYPYDTCANTYQTIKLIWGTRGANEYLAKQGSLYEQYLSKKR